MLTHSFWGTVEESWAGLCAEHPVSVPGFQKQVEVFLGDELFEEDEEYDLTPTQLDEYAATFQDFVSDAPRVLTQLKQRAFEQYQELYAAHYDDPAQSGAPPLYLTTADQHFAYMQNIGYLRISDGNALRLIIHYDLDTEHGLEVLFVNNELAAMGGIAET
ncbi:DUF6985 domain-containing protein [Hymenobacter volaticus]|uniref:DUF6985 domain-containing protein n=1 Tax=Hymenobacter volaticus TaxID=2932254 RepID=A0ABY4G0M4_9BACT|nr:hypothetical protein [Hymenobacter volaticus]UOQ64353.1 hypothetical protein MUN86_12195 [Hymenobacter volaticus]